MLKTSMGRKVSGADLQALQAILVAMGMAQGKGLQELVEATQDLQRASRDWETSAEAVGETYNKRRVLLMLFKLCP